MVLMRGQRGGVCAEVGALVPPLSIDESCRGKGVGSRAAKRIDGMSAAGM